MNSEEIMEMAIEAEFVSHGKPSDEESELFVCLDKDIYKFSKLVAAKAFQSGYEKGIAAFNEAVWIEREACAKLCDKEVEDWKYDADVVDVAIAIRARGEATHSPQRTEQEPWCMKMNGCKTKCEDCPEKVPQRTWVGLTEQERNDIEDYCEMMIGKPAFDAIEAKLKQKNGYAEEENI
jgi:hypothetical protein